MQQNYDSTRDTLPGRVEVVSWPAAARACTCGVKTRS